MRKGLTVTLMTVAIAMMGLQAMAMAPVISEIPSPIVGDGIGSTSPNVFVYPDAFNLANYVTDDYTSSTNILWSYWIQGTPIYRINNIAPLDPGTEDPVTPGAKTINTQVGGTEVNPDGNPATLTIRNIHLSPIGVASGGEPGATGKLTAETQLVTFFASDGTTYSSKTVAFYTYNNFDDQLTPFQTAIPGPHYNFVNSTQGFGFTSFDYFRGTINGVYYGGTLTTSVGTQGVCFSVSAEGNNGAQYASPWGAIQLVKNNVYHVRLKMNGSQATVGHTPFWDVVISNFQSLTSTTWNGLNAYGVDSWFLDNRGGANSVISTTSGTSMHVWFAPAAVQTAAWNAANGVFDPAVGTNRDAYIIWRIMDVDSTQGITASLDSGTLCMTDMLIERFDLASMQTLSTDYNPVLSNGISWNATTGVSTDNGGTMGTHAFYPQTTFTFANGTITCQPNPDATAASNNDLITVYPKDSWLGHFDADPLVPLCYPITWKDDTLYQVAMDLSAPDANSETNPCDVFYVGADVVTNELICDSYTCAAKNACGMPKLGTPQTFMAFFWSHKATLDPVTATINNKRIRPRFQMGSNTSLQFTKDATPTVIVPSQGGIKIHAIKVNEVKFNNPAQ